MLIFKNNIYIKRDGIQFSPENAPEYFSPFDPYLFIHKCLQEEVELLELFRKHPRQFWKDDLASFYPRAHRFANLKTLSELIQILLHGLDSREHWYHMNTYHFSLLYDALNRFAFNYNHDSEEEMVKLFPGLKGDAVNFKLFLRHYFFNYVFLLQDEEYNALSGEEKEKKGYTCSCQFGAINGLQPCPEEMELIQAKDFPYSVYV